MRPLKTLLILFLLLLSLTLQFQSRGIAPVQADNTWNGQDTLHIPLSWCAVQGSPAVANPNLAGDTSTDAILWRRHERPTDNIYVNPTGITFRSAINDVWGTLNFPIIADPDTTFGQVGDMRGENVNVAGVEFNALINNCDTAWAGLGRAGIGVTIVNAGLFHDDDGDYITIIGWGGCTESPAGTCATPFDGRVVVIDNRYLHPASPNRTWPGTTSQFTSTDSLDVLVGHELGHALSLDHRTNTMAMMNPSITDNDGNGDVDNTGINNAEMNALRSNGLNVPGLETDPAGNFNPGRFASTRLPDRVQESENIPAYLDVASVRASLDKVEDTFILDNQLFGLLPAEGRPLMFWTLIDVDDGQSGATREIMSELGIPDATFGGADVIVQMTVAGQRLRGQAWVIRDNEIIEISDRIRFSLNTLVLHPQYAEATIPGPSVLLDDVPVHHVLSFTAPNEFIRVALEQPFRVQTFAIQGGQIIDRLNDENGERGLEFVLEDPSFPHCAPRGTGVPGQTVPVEIEKLRPNAPIHGLLGPELVFTGSADTQGGGVIDLPIPANARPGFHLVTIGVDDTALTADCVLEVEDRPRPPTRPPIDDAFLRSHEDLLRRQQTLIERLGDLIEHLALNPEVPGDRLMTLAESYEALVRRQAALLEDFAEMIRQREQ
ncbi:MAG: hypothetical protein DIU68_008450 [Chloroflexota bacterium]|nr:MAG: hypothetical protein DIU68_02925 [Chloroflexota bacterium]